MPYVVESGPYLSVLASKLADAGRRAALLTELRNGTALSRLCGFDSTNLGADGLDEESRVEHLNRDWFGMAPVAGGQAGAWQKQPNKVPTGFWVGYQGDTESILREAMMRALEVSFDLPPKGAAPARAETAARRWPIDVYWICQGPWFQGWVLWRKGDSTPLGGHVTVIISTPPAKGHPLTAQITRPNAVFPRDAEYACPPPAAARGNSRGMWVVGHDNYTKEVVFSTVPTPFGQVTFPRLAWQPRDIASIVCVAPSEWEGGVLAEGRPYVP